MTAEMSLKQLIESRQARAIALIGAWGRGKTYLWKKLVSSAKSAAWDKYSYVSLFGINSLDDLKLAVFQRDVPVGVETAAEERNSDHKQGGFLKRFNWRTTAETASQIETSWAGNLSSVYRSFAFSQIKDRLVCFDDFERKGPDLHVEEVLGLITYLCEERQCAVVLILNDATMNDLGVSTWNKYRERVFHGEVTFRPSVETCINTIMGDDGSDTWLTGAREVFRQLDVSNMRIISRAKTSLDALKVRYARAHPEVKQGIGASLALLTYCHNASGEGAPPIQWAMHNAYHRLAALTDGDPRTDEEKNWDAIMRKVDFYPDELDQLLADFVRDGYPDFDALDKEIAKLETSIVDKNRESGFQAAWDAYHNSFENDGEELIEKFRKSFPIAAPKTHAMNANSTIALMRRLEREDLADQFIKNWIDARRGNRRGELSISEAQTFGPISDEKFRSALIEAEAEEITAIDFQQAMRTIASGQGDFTRSMEAIANSKQDDVLAWLKANPGRISREFLTRSMHIQGDEQVDKAKVLIRSALEEIGKSSPINAIRIGQMLLAIDGD